MYMKARRRPNIDQVSGVSAQHQHSKSKQHMKSRRRPNIDRMSGVSDISKQAHCGNGSGMGDGRCRILSTMIPGVLGTVPGGCNALYPHNLVC